MKIIVHPTIFSCMKIIVRPTNFSCMKIIVGPTIFFRRFGQLLFSRIKIIVGQLFFWLTKILVKENFSWSASTKSTFWASWSIFLNFWRGRGLPKCSQNRRKSKKHDEKSKLKKHILFNTFFSGFFVLLASENDAKIAVFWLLFRKSRFCENHCFS